MAPPMSSQNIFCLFGNILYRLELMEAVLSDITKAHKPSTYLYNTPAEQFVSTSADIVSLIRIQETIGKIIDDITTKFMSVTNKEGMGQYKLGKSILNTFMNLVENIVNSDSAAAWAQVFNTYFFTAVIMYFN